MKYYKFEVVVREGSDEFWEGLKREGKTGCEEITQEVIDCLVPPSICEKEDIKLVEYTDFN